MAKIAKKKPTKAGRPSAYNDEYAEQARKLCLLGATDREIGDFFGVSEVTVNAWKKQFPQFLKSMQAGKSAADANVANSLYHRALGYSHDAVKILTVSQGANQGSVVEEVPYTEHYPPDTAAASLWLRNRQPAKWRDKQEIEHTGKDGAPLQAWVFGGKKVKF